MPIPNGDTMDEETNTYIVLAQISSVRPDEWFPITYGLAYGGDDPTLLEFKNLESARDWARRKVGRCARVLLVAEG